MLLCYSSSRELRKWCGGILERNGRSGDQIIRNMNTIYSYSGLIGLPRRWIETMICLCLSVLCCDAGRICGCLHIQHFLLLFGCFCGWIRIERGELWTRIFSFKLRLQTNERVCLKIMKVDFESAKYLIMPRKGRVTFPKYLNFGSKLTKSCSDVVQRKVSKMIFSDVYSWSGPISSSCLQAHSLFLACFFPLGMLQSLVYMFPAKTVP